jgi:hypothetical protein
VWLTLVAFSVQLAVVVLHHHHHPVGVAGLAGRAMTAGLCAPSPERPCIPSLPGHDNDGCVLCWAAAMAANTLAPPPFPELPAPPSVVSVRLGSFDCAPARLFHRDHFQARGPPIADAA